MIMEMAEKIKVTHQPRKSIRDRIPCRDVSTEGNHFPDLIKSGKYFLFQGQGNFPSERQCWTCSYDRKLRNESMNLCYAWCPLHIVIFLFSQHCKPVICVLKIAIIYWNMVLKELSYQEVR